MAEVTFIFDQTPTKIQCLKDELFSSIIEKFCYKTKNNPKELYFLYNGQIINQNLKFDKISKEPCIKVLAYSIDNVDKKPDIKISEDIICQKCGETCFIKINDYNIKLSECINGHTMNYKMADFKNTQIKDESKITCANDKTHNKADTSENKFYKCITCKKNLCPLCKIFHNKDHDTIDYDQINYICLNHNEKFSSYCKNCKINLCLECESKHSDKQNLIYFRDILPNKDKFKNILKELETKINEYKIKINEIQTMLNNFISNLEMYCDMNNKLIKNYEKKNRNYQLLSNIIEIEKYNNIVINDLNKIVKTNDINSILNNSFDIVNKMGIQYNTNVISLNRNNNYNLNEDKIKKDNIDEYQTDILNIKQYYENFVKGNNLKKNSNINDKLFYTSMIAEQCSLYDDMYYFLKNPFKQKDDYMDQDENNLFSIACRNLISPYRQAIRTIQAYENKERKKDNSPYLPYIIEYKKIVETKFYGKCYDIIQFLDNNIITQKNFGKTSDKIKTFFYKMKGDYYKYISETDNYRNKYSKETCKYYNESLQFANNLPIYNSRKLGLILNMTVFYYEITGETKKAIELAKSTIQKFDKEAKNLDEEDDDVKYAMSIYNLMKENLDMWESK